MKKRIFIVFAIAVNAIFVKGQEMNDLELMNLKGKVKSLTETCFKAEEKFGELGTGNKDRGSSTIARTAVNKDFFIKFGTNGYYANTSYYYGNGNISNKLIYEYSGNILLKMKEEIFESNGSFNGKTDYIYNNKGNQIEEVAYSSTSELLSKDKYKYESDNLVELNTYYSTGELYSKLKYKYADNNLIEENYYLEDGSLYYRSKYSNDNKGRCIGEVIYDSNGLKNTSTAYKYDSYGNINEIKTEGTDDFGLPKTVINYYEYNSKKQLIKEKVSTNGGSWSNTFVFKYDNKGNIIEVKNTGGSNQLIYTWTYKYKFDKIGNWIEKIEYKNSMAKYILKRTFEYY